MSTQLRPSTYLRKALGERCLYRNDGGEHERKLLVASRNGDNAARDELIESMIGLVYDIAFRVQTRKVDVEDLISEGIVGAIKGIDKYDLSRNVRVGTYVAYRIFKQISEFLGYRMRIIHVPRLAAGGTKVRIQPLPGQHLFYDHNDLLLVDAKIDAEFFLGLMTSKQAETCRLYYGIGDGKSHSLEEIAKKKGCWKQNIGEHKDKGIKQVRGYLENPAVSRKRAKTKKIEAKCG